MNISEVNKEIAIAMNQAAISQGKMKKHETEGNIRASEVYKVRWLALRCYVDKLREKLKNYQRRKYKEINSK